MLLEEEDPVLLVEEEIVDVGLVAEEAPVEVPLGAAVLLWDIVAE